ncbi:MAG: TIGR00730 family Rossman fold protein [Dehalococcoidia bacterium]
MVELRRICVFCGSSPGLKPAYLEATVRLAGTLAGNGIGLVYGGAHVGLMGVLADSMLGFDGEVIGVIPRSLQEWEIAHTGLSDLRVVETMHERKALMAELADGFIALPGGMGTLEEFCEMLTWVQLGLHQKPCGVLNVEEFFAPLLRFFDHMVEQRFLRPEYRAAIHAEPEPEILLDRFAEYQPARVPKWLDLPDV